METNYGDAHHLSRHVDDGPLEAIVHCNEHGSATPDTQLLPLLHDFADLCVPLMPSKSAPDAARLPAEGGFIPVRVHEIEPAAGQRLGGQFGVHLKAKPVKT